MQTQPQTQQRGRRRRGRRVPDLWVLLARIEWGLRPPGVLSASQQPWLAAQLRDLERMLDARFAEEEDASPLYREVPIQEPRLAPHVETLRRDHPTLRGWLHRLVEVASLPPDPVLLATLTAEVRDLLRAVRRHERSEEETLQDAVGTDIPATD